MALALPPYKSSSSTPTSSDIVKNKFPVLPTFNCEITASLHIVQFPHNQLEKDIKSFLIFLNDNRNTHTICSFLVNSGVLDGQGVGVLALVRPVVLVNVTFHVTLPKNTSIPDFLKV